MEEKLNKNLSILRKTSLEFKFVAIKLIPGFLCSQNVLI